MNQIACELFEPFARRLALCADCDPVWKAIQAEALEHAEQEPLLAPTFRRLVIEQPNLVTSLGHVFGERLFGDEAQQFAELMSGAVDAEPNIRTAILADLQAIRRQDPATTSYLNPFLHFKGFLALEAYRVAHWLWKNDRRMLAYHIQSRVSEVFGVDIHPAARIGHGVFIDHATSVVIGETAVVGNNVVILHGVTLGATGMQSGDRHPKVGNGVLIGAGAQLLGNITIGDAAKVGAGSVVVKTVPAGETAVGVAARVKTKRDRTLLPLPTKFHVVPVSNP